MELKLVGCTTSVEHQLLVYQWSAAKLVHITFGNWYVLQVLGGSLSSLKLLSSVENVVIIRPHLVAVSRIGSSLFSFLQSYVNCNIGIKTLVK